MNLRGLLRLLDRACLPFASETLDRRLLLAAPVLWRSRLPSVAWCMVFVCASAALGAWWRTRTTRDAVNWHSNDDFGFYLGSGYAVLMMVGIWLTRMSARPPALLGTFARIRAGLYNATCVLLITVVIPATQWGIDRNLAQSIPDETFQRSAAYLRDHRFLICPGVPTSPGLTREGLREAFATFQIVVVPRSVPCDRYEPLIPEAVRAECAGRQCLNFSDDRGSGWYDYENLPKRIDRIAASKSSNFGIGGTPPLAPALVVGVSLLLSSRRIGIGLSAGFAAFFRAIEVVFRWLRLPRYVPAWIRAADRRLLLARAWIWGARLPVTLYWTALSFLVSLPVVAGLLTKGRESDDSAITVFGAVIICVQLAATFLPPVLSVIPALAPLQQAPSLARIGAIVATRWIASTSIALAGLLAFQVATPAIVRTSDAASLFSILVAGRMVAIVATFRVMIAFSKAFAGFSAGIAIAGLSFGLSAVPRHDPATMFVVPVVFIAGSLAVFAVARARPRAITVRWGIVVAMLVGLAPTALGHLTVLVAIGALPFGTLDAAALDRFFTLPIGGAPLFAGTLAASVIVVAALTLYMEAIVRAESVPSR